MKAFMLLGMQLLYILYIHTFVKRVNFNSLWLPCIMPTVAIRTTIRMCIYYFAIDLLELNMSSLNCLLCL